MLSLGSCIRVCKDCGLESVVPIRPGPREKCSGILGNTQDRIGLRHLLKLSSGSSNIRQITLEPAFMLKAPEAWGWSESDLAHVGLCDFRQLASFDIVRPSEVPVRIAGIVMKTFQEDIKGIENEIRSKVLT